MKLGYSNKELAGLIKRNGLNLKEEVLYYFSPGIMPSNMIQKNMFSERFNRLFKMGNLPFYSERQGFHVLMAVLALDGFVTPLDENALDGLKKENKAISLAMKTKDPCVASMTVKPIVEFMDWKLVKEWGTFVRLLLCRYKFSPSQPYNSPFENLMRTGEKILCYAHINDKSLGIYDSPQEAYLRYASPDEWKGANVHGRILMTVREDMRSVRIRKAESNEGVSTRIVIKCSRPGLLKYHVDMATYLSGMQEGTATLNLGINENVPWMHEVVLSLTVGKKTAMTVDKFKRFLLEYPGLEIL